MDHMVPGNSMDHGHSHGLWHQQRPQTLAWSPVAIQMTDFNTALGHSIDIKMVSGGNRSSTWSHAGRGTDCRHPKGLQMKHKQRPQTSAWVQAAAKAKDIHINFDGSEDHMVSCRGTPWASQRPLATAWTMDITWPLLVMCPTGFTKYHSKLPVPLVLYTDWGGYIYVYYLFI